MIKLLVLCALCLGVKGTWFTKRIEYPRKNGSIDRANNIVVDSLPMVIDHFSFWTSTTYQMRYAYNAEFFSGSGPLFLVIGGESSLESQIGLLENGPVFDMAKEKEAYLCMTEHRFYGQSIPNSNLYTSNLEYLTIEQALEDIATFIINRKKTVPGLKNSKVLVIGGSYPGSLAAWARLKYPDLVDLAYSSSGIFNLKPNNFEYNEIVQKVLGQQNSSCLSTIKNGFANLTELLKTNVGARRIERDFNLCGPLDITNSQDIGAFFQNLIVIFDSIVQYNQPTMGNDVEVMCKLLLTNSSSSSDYDRLAYFISIYQLAAGQLCTPTYIDDVYYFRNTTAPNDDRSWDYQMCTQIGSFQTTDSSKQAFNNSLPLRFWTQSCRDVFNFFFPYTTVLLETWSMRFRYGGDRPPVTKTVFTVGSSDPWSGIGVKQGNNDTAPLIVIKGASHCTDLLPQEIQEIGSLTEARSEVKKYLYSWL